MTHQEFVQSLIPCKNALKDKMTLKFRRRKPREEDGILNPFIRDQRAILNSKAWRGMVYKTQVTSFNVNACIRNRMTHTTEVSAVATTIAEILGLNIELVRAMAFQHDIGHVAFGHQGEDWISKAIGKKFTHEVMGVVVAQHVERKCEGMNLCFETLEAWRHSGKNGIPEMSQEAWVLNRADKIAYLFSDYNDLFRIGAIIPDELVVLMEDFGANQRQRVSRAISALCIESAEKGLVSFQQSEWAEKFQKIYSLMNTMYPKVTEQDVNKFFEPITARLKQMDVGDPFLILSLMTDEEVRFLAGQSMLNTKHFCQTGIWEGVPYLRGKSIDICKLDLDWSDSVQSIPVP
jgi:dGTPase